MWFLRRRHRRWLAANSEFEVVWNQPAIPNDDEQHEEGDAAYDGFPGQESLHRFTIDAVKERRRGCNMATLDV